MQKLPIPDLPQLRVNRKQIAAIAIPVLAFGALAAIFNNVFFYNEAGQMTHVRTIFGEEKVVEDVGYATKWFGRSTAWRRTIGVPACFCTPENGLEFGPPR